jgi:hypothetical protein
MPPGAPYRVFGGHFFRPTPFQSPLKIFMQNLTQIPKHWNDPHLHREGQFSPEWQPDVLRGFLKMALLANRGF